MVLRDRLLRRSWWTLPLAVAAVAALALPSVASAGAPAPKWHFQWRPNWIPGDPGSEPIVSILPETLLRSGSLVASPGLFIAIDPETRKPVMPSPEQRKALAADAARSAALHAPISPDAYLPSERIPGGGELVHLDGRFQVYSIARRDANGNITTDCDSDLESIQKLLSTPAPTTRVREER
jgi:hypothetical protein